MTHCRHFERDGEARGQTVRQDQIGIDCASIYRGFSLIHLEQPTEYPIDVREVPLVHAVQLAVMLVSIGLKLPSVPSTANSRFIPNSLLSVSQRPVPCQATFPSPKPSLGFVPFSINKGPSMNRPTSSHRVTFG